MRADTAPDHGSLALLAQNPAAELRPLLLRVHVQNFAQDRQRDAATVSSFETIALGLIPLVPDDVLADVARILERMADAPRSVLSALLDRLSFDDTQQSEPDADRVLPPQTTTENSHRPHPEVLHEAKPRRTHDAGACFEGRLRRPPQHEEGWGSYGALRLQEAVRDHRIALNADALDGLVERAISDRDLALALLGRPEPTVFDRAALYRHADATTRDAIRRDLAQALAAIHLPRPARAGEAACVVQRIARRGDVEATLATVASLLGVGEDRFDLDDGAGQELFVFGLIAIGLDETECIGALLMLGAAVSRSVPGMFRLSGLARTTPRPVAAFLAGWQGNARSRGPEDRPPPRPLAALRRDPARAFSSEVDPARVKTLRAASAKMRLSKE